MNFQQLPHYTQHMITAAVEHGIANEQEILETAERVYRAVVSTNTHDGHYLIDSGVPSHVDYGTAICMIEAGGAANYAQQIELDYVAKGFPQEAFSVPLWRIMNHLATNTTAL